LLNVDWAQASGWALTGAFSGAFLGVIGCGYALASDLSTRRYAKVDAATRGWIASGWRMLSRGIAFPLVERETKA
jgi:hypothetical protein